MALIALAAPALALENPNTLSETDKQASLDFHNDLRTSTCTGVCGHYTQMIWDDTRYLVVATRIARRALPGSPPGQLVLVCNYFPGGNYSSQTPYDLGTPCTSVRRKQPRSAPLISATVATEATPSSVSTSPRLRPFRCWPP